MRVLLVNKFYYPRGGDCVVVINTQALLRAAGVDAQVFAMAYPDNLPATYQESFASEVSFGGGVAGSVRALGRTLGLGDVKTRFEAVLDDFKPDVVHLHNIHSYLSPVVGEIAHKRGVRVVWTLHDYKLLCPRYDCLLDGRPCEQCFAGSKHHVLNNRCMKGSLVASAVAWLEAMRWNRRRLERHTDLFVCPSRFMASKMQQGGFAADKITVLNNCLDPVKQAQFQQNDTAARREDYYCYVGRLSREKGVETLLRAAAGLPYRLKVAGTGPMEQSLRERFAGCGNIEFLGRLDAPGVAALLSRARLSVVPSQWYENNPLSVIESLCAGTPVVGANMGGIPELLDSNSGIVTAVFDRDALAAAISEAMTRDWNRESIANQALDRFDPKAHINALVSKVYRIGH